MCGSDLSIRICMSRGGKQASQNPLTPGQRPSQRRQEVSTRRDPDRAHWVNRWVDLSTNLTPELFYDRGNHYEFVSLSQELAAAGEMRQAQTFDFIFKNVEKQYESYSGINVKLRYVAAGIRGLKAGTTSG